jgi:FKBP-type peptidyl-prolyl cis-trans isomerase
MKHLYILSIFILLFVAACSTSADDACSPELDQQFLLENAEKEEINVTDSGLQYRVIEEGEGARPTQNSTVRVHYHGTLINGDVFDTTRDREDPVQLALNQVIRGFSEGLQLMPEGSIYEIFIPASSAYGNSPPPGSIICRGSTLIFELELVEIL